MPTIWGITQLSLPPYGSSAGETSELRFRELVANGSNYVGFKAADSIASSLIWTLPDEDGTTGQVLTTDGSGNLTWTAGGAVTISGFQTSTFAGLPSPGTPGEARYVTDNRRGIFLDQGSQWVGINDPVNVALLGAVLDGATNCDAAVQEAIDAGATWIYLPANAYWIPSEVVPANVRITGADWGSVVVDTRAVVGGLGFWQSNSGAALENVTLRDNNGSGRVYRTAQYGNTSYSTSAVNQDVFHLFVKSGTSGTENSAGIVSIHSGLGSGDCFYGAAQAGATQFIDACYRADMISSAAGGTAYSAFMLAGGTMNAETRAITIQDQKTSLNDLIFYNTTAKTSGNVFTCRHATSTYSGNFINLQGALSSGAFTGKFLDGSIGGVSKASLSPLAGGVNPGLRIEGTLSTLPAAGNMFTDLSAVGPYAAGGLFKVSNTTGSGNPFQKQVIGVGVTLNDQGGSSTGGILVEQNVTNNTLGTGEHAGLASSVNIFGTTAGAAWGLYTQVERKPNNSGAAAIIGAQIALRNSRAGSNPETTVGLNISGGTNVGSIAEGAPGLKCGTAIQLDGLGPGSVGPGWSRGLDCSPALYSDAAIRLPINVDGTSGQIKWDNNTGITSIVSTQLIMGEGVKVAGPGQASRAIAAQSVANLRGALTVQDTGGSANSGGAVVFGSTQGFFSAIKGCLFSGTGNTTGFLSFENRQNPGDANLTEVATIGSGLVVGTATGGDKGLGTINVSVDIYKNNTAYNNPDYVFEKAYTGDIVRFRENPGAKSYPGLLPLEDVEHYAQAFHHLPRMHQEAAGMFERGDMLLEKLEEAYLHLFALHRRVKELEAKFA